MGDLQNFISGLVEAKKKARSSSRYLSRASENVTNQMIALSLAFPKCNDFAENCNSLIVDLIGHPYKFQNALSVFKHLNEVSLTQQL